MQNVITVLTAARGTDLPTLYFSRPLSLFEDRPQDELVQVITSKGGIRFSCVPVIALTEFSLLAGPNSLIPIEGRELS